MHVLPIKAVDSTIYKSEYHLKDDDSIFQIIEDEAGIHIIEANENGCYVDEGFIVKKKFTSVLTERMGNTVYVLQVMLNGD